ncbi:MAG: SurA N-terminal domain-containing protein [Actinomycetota bacterium]|nr:SurA N-terminal domain-containing protein [Actinomycetota bacterium]
MTISRRRALIPAALLALGLMVSACSSASSGADAAVVGDTHISNDQFESALNAVLLAQGKPTNTADSELVNQTLNWMIVLNLLEQVAADNAVVVTQGDIDRERASEVQAAGSEAALKDAYLKQLVAPERIDDRIRFALLAQAVAAKIAPGQTADEATTALITTVIAKSNALDPQVNPRYGTWDSSTLQIGSSTSGLSSPLPTATPNSAPAQ